VLEDELRAVEEDAGVADDEAVGANEDDDGGL
jgi:hypothetical protein